MKKKSFYVPTSLQKHWNLFFKKKELIPEIILFGTRFLKTLPTLHPKTTNF